MIPANMQNRLQLQLKQRTFAEFFAGIGLMRMGLENAGWIAAFNRQKEMPGMMVAGAVMQHLVGAKLEIMSVDVSIEHRGFSVADSPGGHKGDFLVHDAAIHVTTAPTEALIRKCQDNLD